MSIGILLYTILTLSKSGSWNEKLLFELDIGRAEYQIGIDESGMSTPYFTVDESENIYVWDIYNKAVKLFNKKGKLIKILPLPKGYEVWGLVAFSNSLYLLLEKWEEDTVIYSLRKYTFPLEYKKTLLEDTLNANEVSGFIRTPYGHEMLVPQMALETDWKYIYVPEPRDTVFLSQKEGEDWQTFDKRVYKAWDDILLQMDTAGHIIKRIHITSIIKNNIEYLMGEKAKDTLRIVEDLTVGGLGYLWGSFGQLFYRDTNDSLRIFNPSKDMLLKISLKDLQYAAFLGMDTNYNVYVESAKGVVQITPKGELIECCNVRFSGTGFSWHSMITPNGTIYNIEWVFDESKQKIVKIRFWKYYRH